jgi:hypothetical protein
MAVGLNDRGELVVDDLVGMEDVCAVVDDDVTVEREHVSDAGLPVGIKLDWDAAGRLRFGLGDGNEFLAGIVGKLADGVVRGCDWDGTGNCGEDGRRRGGWG